MKKTCNTFKVLLFVISSFLIPKIVLSQVLYKKSVTYYNIHSKAVKDLDKTVKNLDKEISQHNPLGLDHPSITQIYLDGQVPYIQGKSFCCPGEPRVKLSLKIILPNWKNRKYAEPEMALIWDSFNSDIKRHEENHAEIAKSYARELYNSLRSLKIAKDCKTLRKSVEEITRRNIKSHDKAQENFDRIEKRNFSARMKHIIFSHIRK